jgi:hypothetical protein
MQNWEYLAVIKTGDSVKYMDSIWRLEDFLASVGKEGWEMVGIEPEDSGTSRLYFKRIPQVAGEARTIPIKGF